MARLYDIADRFTNLQELLESGAVDELTLQEAMSQIDGEFEEKADNIAFILKDLLTTAKAIKEEEQRLSQRRKALENNADRLKDHLESMMRLIDKPKFKTTLNSFTISRGKPTVVIENEDLVPLEYKALEETIKIDKNAIYTALKNGENIDGVSLQENESLKIK